MYKPEREKEILDFWKKNKIFEKSLEKTKGGEPFVFYDGPPFATGLPHFGHALPSTLKDIIPRYQTMKGRYVPRVWGWDCHGLPVENLIEKNMGLKSKKDIEELGVGKFNKAARESVLQYADEWKKIIPRLGRWVDMDNDYRTMNPSYTESVWWSFKNLYDKNLAYEGFRAMQICPRCETTISNFEVAQGYKDITDISVYVKFELTAEPGVFLLAWTTTPWTLPGNVALAVGSEIDYVKVKIKDTEGFFIMAKERTETVLKAYEFEVVGEMKGAELVGKSYKPAFDYYSSQADLDKKENGWKVYGAGFVTTTDGTGIVHIAPAFGEDDLNLGIKESLPFVQHVSPDGTLKKEAVDFAGLKAKPKAEEKDGHQATDVEIIKYLAKQGTLFAKEKIIHSYPHCWRCETPLLNYATSSWFIKVTELRDKMVEANKKVGWTPEHIGSGRFGKWLENARDWSISRSRYWGAPLPIWQSEDKKETEVIGSIEELRSKIRRNHFIALRHGEGEHNVKGVLNSSNDTPHHLTEKGKKQVEESSKTLKDIDFVYASPLIRTQETAEIFKQVSGFKGEIVTDERLREFGMGDFNGRPRTEYLAYEEKTGGNTLDFVIPSGESYREIRDRVSDFLYDIDKKHEGKKILIVTHEGIMKTLEAVALGGREEDLNRVWKQAGVCTGTLCDIDFAALPKNDLNEIDLHRPYIDSIEWKSASDKLMKRIPDVFDTWYDSGSMPFASKHYPFENKEAIDQGKLFPADYIAEAIDQTRGWFYSLLVLGVGLFENSPYRNVVVTGLVLAEDGRKMSKSLKNYPDLLPTVETYGADSLRYFLTSSPVIKGEDVNFSEKSLDEIVKKHFNRLFNVLSLYEMFAEETIADNNFSPEGLGVLDQWIIARLCQVSKTMTDNLESYQLDRAIRPVADFIDDLSVWYIRRSRDRFKGENEVDKSVALSTTRFVLLELSKIMAPFTPFLAEELYQKLSKNEESVHLEKWPNHSPADSDELVLKRMAEVRRIVSLALEARSKFGIKVRQPLARLMVREDSFDISENSEYAELIKDEVNVKEVVLDGAISDEIILDTSLTPELIKEGVARDVMRFVQDMRKKAGLSPKDPIVLTVETNENGKQVIESFKEEIMKIAKVADFLFEDIPEGEVLAAETFSFKFSLKKI